MELGEPEKKKKRQVSKDERLARLDKRIKKPRAIQELARLVMGTIFLVIIHMPMRHGHQYICPLKLRHKPKQRHDTLPPYAHGFYC